MELHAWAPLLGNLVASPDPALQTQVLGSSPSPILRARGLQTRGRCAPVGAKELWRTPGPLRTAGGWVGARGVTPQPGWCVF